MEDNEIKKQTDKETNKECNKLGNGNEKCTKISTRNVSREVTNMYRWKLVKYDMLVQNGLVHNGNSSFT
jgi:hypothetical protein